MVLAFIVTGVGQVFDAIAGNYHVFLTILLFFISLLIFLTTRHIQLVNRRRSTKISKQASFNRRRSPQDYSLFVLGSGGHTKEMLMMMDDGFCNFDGFHRRYLISSGDTMSINHLADYEAELATLCAAHGTKPGTFDTVSVTRARRIHQSLLTTPFTAFLSIVSILPALLKPPANETGAKLKYPSCIYSNGPATGFFVGLTAHLLKMLYLVPETSMHLIYIESWARISTLSLTGKLFHYTGIADVMVQHGEVANKYGLKNCGPMVFNARRDA
ncbi:beta-1,4-N-acetylglucosaminyltransferase [Fusarium austroafricanum]|uniref:UDP-N-acetylglucosamine transferase subunit ALG14 n=1 Tax=Fusarium austroafricanum TaxID=2364996 RepID=A0A8H4KTH3_9HYPO|nr:beta-1,4-N-acetylglucosaminyltransferase [Fusarium austroafricanum]